MRLPNGVQNDEADARALAFVRADEELTVNVKPAADAMLAALVASGHAFETPAQQDFVHGNVKARERMIAQYAVARRGIVIGTDHAAESLMGFFTKFGDGGADILPLAGLNKRRVRAVARALGGDELIVMKVPTADLEELRPLRPTSTRTASPTTRSTTSSKASPSPTTCTKRCCASTTVRATSARCRTRCSTGRPRKPPRLKRRAHRPCARRITDGHRYACPPTSSPAAHESASAHPYR